MALLTAVNINDSAGTQVDFVAATVTTGDTVALVDDRAKLLVNNGSGAPITVTIPSYKTLYGLTVPDRVVTVAAGKLKAIPLYYALNADPANSYRAKFTCSAVTTVTVAVTLD